jgi:FtsZ-binding cell division protein ZapB
MNDMENNNAPELERHNNFEPESVPVGIARIRDEWRSAGLKDEPTAAVREGKDMEPVIFPEVNGGAGIGDYTLDCDSVMNQLALSREAMDRIVSSGEIDSILVQGIDGQQRRMLSESSVRRFETDSAIDTHAFNRAAKALADATLVESIQQLQAEIDELRNTQGKVLGQMKDTLLLEVRNLKEQDRDLASYVFELAEEIRSVMGKKRH